MDGIYFYINSRDSISDLCLEFSLRYGITILTISKHIKSRCKGECILISKSHFSFKRDIKKIPIKLMLLVGDNYHFDVNYISINYESIVISPYIMIADCEMESKLINYNNKTTLAFLYSTFGMSHYHCGKRVIPYERSFSCFVKHLIKKYVYGMRFASNHAGSFSNKVFISSKYGANVFLESGIDKNKVVITGSLEADRLYLNERKRVPTSKEYDIVYIIQPLHDKGLVGFDYFGRLEKFLKKLSKYKVALKLHPRSRIKDFLFCDSMKNVDVFSYDDKRSNALVFQTSLVIGLHSTYLFTPLFNQIPVIFLDYKELKIIEQFKKYGILYSDNDSDSIKLIEYALNEKNYTSITSSQRKFLNTFDSFDGKNHERIYTELSRYYEENIR